MHAQIGYIKYTNAKPHMHVHTERGYSVHSPKRMTSLEPLGDCRLNEKQTERNRG